MKSKQENYIVMAEQQILGWHSRDLGESIGDLCKAMGLTKEEYKEMIKRGHISFLADDLKKEIKDSL
ncbi:MAG: hypothetical protein WC346_06800 [Methanogenium sp.]|jgi:hypothetical protein